MDAVQAGNKGWPVEVITSSEPSIESVSEALRNGPYGICAYESDNDVCDNQVVNMQFSNGVTASFTMIAFSKEICVRKTRIYGTLVNPEKFVFKKVKFKHGSYISKGQLDCDGYEISHFDFRTNKTTVYKPEADVPKGKNFVFWRKRISYCHKCQTKK